MQADFVLDYSVIAVQRPQRVYLLARIQAEPPANAAARRPLNLSLVLDRSGSMGGSKLSYVQQAAQFLVQRLGAADRLSVVSYNEHVTVDAPPSPVVEKDRLISAIRALSASGTTNLSGGWLQGCQLVAQEQRDGQINRVLLLTDGLANQGITAADRLEALARQKRAEGITTTTLGVGLQFNEDLLRGIAREGGGAYYFIDNPDQAPAIFGEELQDLLNVVGQNLTITVTLSPDVRMIRQLNDYRQQEQGGAVVFSLGDLFADELKSLLLELAIPALDHLGEVEVARLRFEYDELGDEAVVHRVLDLPIRVNIVPDSEFTAAQRDPEVIKSALLLQATRAREEAMRYADRGEFERASEVLDNTSRMMRQSGLIDEELRRRHDMLAEEAADMRAGATRYDDYYRKSFSTKIAYAERDSDRREGFTQALHARQRSTRTSYERHGPTPSLLTWMGGSQPLVGRVTIGRAEDNVIVIDEEPVSRYHCEITREGDFVILRDLASTNGTFANGGRIAGNFRLSVGDVIGVGSRLFMLEGEAGN